jgi:formylglycine-generating enzyme
MNMNYRKFIKPFALLFGVVALSACSEKSSTTGWDYNTMENGGFQANLKYPGQDIGPGLVFIEGGTFTMGRVEQDVMYDWNNIPRRVTVSSFYMDET